MLGGTEVTCGVIDAEPDGEPQALPVTEIRPVESSFFDYHAKYTPGACEEITPAEIDEAETRAVQEAAVKAHRLLGCRGMSRVDFFMEEDGPYVIEVNTIPGMTETSLLPQAAAEAGISFSELLTRLIEGALARAKRDAGDR
jgi:D-alanine-D-alanine ligase